MMITRITKIHSHRVFRNFSWPLDLHTFGQFNLIYGWNGCGKTTLSALFAYLEKRTCITEGEVEFEIDDDRKCLGSQVESAELPPVRVFNRDFVEATIKEVHRGIAPIFYLGEDSIEKQVAVDKLKSELRQALDDLSASTQAKATADAALDKFFVDQAKVIKELLRGADGAGYASYDKRGFKRAMEAMSADAVATAKLGEDDRERSRKQKDAQPKDAVTQISIDVPDFTALWTRAEELLQRSVVSTVLEELEDDRKLRDWVQEGLNLHSGKNNSDHCRFCTQPLPEDRRKSLEAHFNDALAVFQQDIRRLLADVEGAKKALGRASFPDAARLYDHIHDEFSASLKIVRQGIIAAISKLDALTKLLSEKESAPFQEAAPGLAAMPAVDKLTAAVTAANAIITKHNDTTADFRSKVVDACKKLELHYIAEGWDEHANLASVAATAEKALPPLRTAIDTLQRTVADIERDIREDLRPAEELNSELRAYLGRDELRFEVKESGYALTRSGQPVTNLSEGERTAIAFLYFLKSLQDQSFKLENGVVVIDDPVSSLDANALFSAFGYMKERTKECGQLFVLTHNFAFFRQVKNWFRHLKGQNKQNVELRPARFFLLTASADSQGRRQAEIGPIDPLLEQYESEYHYLFRRVHDEASNGSGAASLEHYYSMPNIARRLVETFLSFRYPDCRDGFTKQLDRVEFDRSKKTRILRLLHTYSHSAGIGEPGHDPSFLAETRPVLGEILEMIKTVDPVHYEGMHQLVGSNGDLA